MIKLPLAVEIADIVAKAANETGPLDVDAAADWLYDAHIYGGVTRDEIAQVLREEGAATGAIEPGPQDL